MKRINNLFEKIVSLDNLRVADEKAQKGKSKQYGVRLHNLNRERNLNSLRESLLNKTYKTSDYSVFKIYEPKEREIFRLPFFPDRIVHHAIMNVLEPLFVNCFVKDTYSAIKGRGIHLASRDLKKVLRDVEGTVYCLKLDIKKFYPNINHGVLKSLVRRKIKDKDLLCLLDEIIDSAPGLPIGNYLSQYLANFYLTYFDHWLKEVKGVKYYFRYADDMVILSEDKTSLHKLLVEIREYLGINLKLVVKDNHQIFPVEARGIDFLGYRFYHTHTLLRKSIKQRFIKATKHGCNASTVAAYKGWTDHCNSKNLINKVL